ncbi:tRNA lysidine(34) synthetase TilS [Eubacterium multiforme]|uniref:tRNA(Ile)-lysidine synthase n=1 Tax=Eubacterium multiforme TaxID=83339 RepID=A0ABT9UY93_9FIRM|nr:tRNA lysidine(34) synthetase TilS [Eubacterium multiforme]MDQ0151288.1 tRNA(Ile)-lysidine synthase [Eubacterium multiforme]
MINDFTKYIEENKLLSKGDKVLVGLSGGPDSVCLLHLLNTIKDKYALEIGAAHINHMLRGEEAMIDEEYAKNLCESLDIKFYSIRLDINKIAKDRGVSTETAGRDERYKFFNDVKNKEGYTKIATAHNANDQAETILMRIMRGTGLEGLGGIPVEREGLYIRPILFLEREFIEKYCSDNNLNPRIDKTNLENIYSRNKIRLDILPYMKKNFNNDVVKAINRMSLLLQEDNEFINNEAIKAFNKYCSVKNNEIIINRELFDEEKAIITRVIRKSLTTISKSTYDFEMKHIKEVINLKDIGTNKRVDLPNGIYAENIYGEIYIKEKDSLINKNNECSEVRIKKEDLNGLKIDFLGCLIEFEVNLKEKNLKFNNNDLIKYFDYDKINEYVTLRKRKNGDRIVPLGMSGSKKLKDIFIDMKIPKDYRDNIPVIQFDDEIAWVVGVKTSNTYKVNKTTKKIMKIIFKREEL